MINEVTTPLQKKSPSASIPVSSTRLTANTMAEEPPSAPPPPGTALLHTSLPDVKLLSRGKVRDIYATSDPSALLFVATDRISAYDVILNNVPSLLSLSLSETALS